MRRCLVRNKQPTRCGDGSQRKALSEVRDRKEKSFEGKRGDIGSQDDRCEKSMNDCEDDPNLLAFDAAAETAQ